LIVFDYVQHRLHLTRIRAVQPNLPHAETHAIVLPHAMAYNSAAVPDLDRRIAEILGAPDAAASLYDLARRLGIPAGLRRPPRRACVLPAHDGSPMGGELF
jgi:alcohol dehydrogenase class IV